MQDRAVVRALTQPEASQAIQAVFARIPGYREPSELMVIPMQVLAYLWAEDPQESMTALMEAVENLPPAAQYRILMTEPQESETWNSPTDWTERRIRR